MCIYEMKMDSSCQQVVILLALCCLAAELFGEVDGAEFLFKRFNYKKKRDDKRYKHAKERCERYGECEGRHGVEYISCLRMCMSQRCYDELYAFDKLEEGEVDVRLNSFKGCLYQQPVESF